AYRTGEPKRVGVQFPIGGRLPVHIAAGARAIMAFSSPDLVDYMLEGELTPWTPKTITDRAVLKKNLGEYRRHGVAFDLGETDIDSYFIAAPIFDHTKKPVAAIILGDLARKINGRFSPKLISAIKQTAAKISAQLLYSEDET
ncbi:MAG: IclR family transcriptional regulator C-terminal domain-containing protein, partial [Pseudomonadota bacterium]